MLDHRQRETDRQTDRQTETHTGEWGDRGNSESESERERERERERKILFKRLNLPARKRHQTKKFSTTTESGPTTAESGVQRFIVSDRSLANGVTIGLSGVVRKYFTC